MANPLFLANFFVSVIPAAVVANWLYYRNNRSILAAVLLHAMLNAAAVLPNASQVAKVIVTLVYLVIALGLVAFDRTTFGAGPRDFVADPAQPRI
jgi:membrane protease YdiL (CAAX protease family)